MKLLTLAAVILLSVSSVFAGTFKSTEGRFSADFVATPTIEIQHLKTAKDESVTVTNFFAISEDKTTGQLVDFTDFPQHLTDAQLLETAKAAYEGMTLDGVGTTKFDGRTWILAAGRDDKMLYFYASTCVGKRLYEVTIAERIKNATSETEKAAEAFLASVKITE